MNFTVQLQAPWWLPDYYESYEVLREPDWEPLEADWFASGETGHDQAGSSY